MSVIRCRRCLRDLPRPVEGAVLDLAAGADRRAYGAMLIRTAGRPGPAPLLAPALVELPSLLERRIIAMTSRIPAHARLRAALAGSAALVLFVAACEMTPRGSGPTPTEPTKRLTAPSSDSVPPANRPRPSTSAISSALLLSPTPAVFAVTVKLSPAAATPSIRTRQPPRRIAENFVRGRDPLEPLVPGCRSCRAGSARCPCRFP